MKVITVTAVNSQTDKGDAFIRDYHSINSSTSPLIVETLSRIVES